MNWIIVWFRGEEPVGSCFGSGFNLGLQVYLRESILECPCPSWYTLIHLQLWGYWLSVIFNEGVQQSQLLLHADLDLSAFKIQIFKALDCFLQMKSYCFVFKTVRPDFLFWSNYRIPRTLNSTGPMVYLSPLPLTASPWPLRLLQWLLHSPSTVWKCLLCSSQTGPTVLQVYHGWTIHQRCML